MILHLSFYVFLLGPRHRDARGAGGGGGGVHGVAVAAAAGGRGRRGEPGVAAGAGEGRVRQGGRAAELPRAQGEAQGHGHVQHRQLGSPEAQARRSP